MKSAFLPVVLASGILAGGSLLSTVGVAAEAEPIVVAQAGAAGAPVSYSAEQAESGKKRYEKECGECHGKDLKGGLIGGPPLRGVQFIQKYADDTPASVLFGYMSSAMPPNAPGRYSPTAYAELMAYILKMNGFRAGEPLPSTIEALDTLVIKK